MFLSNVCDLLPVVDVRIRVENLHQLHPFAFQTAFFTKPTLAMIGHSLLSGLLLLLPIAATVGIYIGVQFQKIFNSGFDGKYGVPGSGGTNPGRTGGVETNMYCQKLIGISPQGSRYTCELTLSVSALLRLTACSCHHRIWFLQ